VNCPAVRDRLPEHALGVVDHHDATAIERHLAWCAACRKEARDLERAAATMAFALAPARPSAELGERVVGAVRRVSAPTPPVKPGRRRGRRVGVVLLAAALTLASLGFGTVLGHRDGPPAVDPANRGTQQEEVASKFTRAIAGALQAAAAADPRLQAQIGTLAATHGADASGAALTLESPSADDQVVVWVNGLSPKRIPYLVFLTDSRGNAFEVVRINRLDRDGGTMRASVVGRNLSRYERMIVRDARGRIVLSGTLAPAPPTG
jgi:predicted anti-sigma-YlaC factor YlaD